MAGTAGIGRLRRRADFLAAARSGTKAARKSLVLQARDRRDDQADIRVGYTASRKVGGAVDRNRAKRRLRAAVREHLPQAGRAGYDYVLVARSATVNLPFSTIVSDLGSALAQVHRVRHAQPAEAAPSNA